MKPRKTLITIAIFHLPFSICHFSFFICHFSLSFFVIYQTLRTAMTNGKRQIENGKWEMGRLHMKFGVCSRDM